MSKLEEIKREILEKKVIPAPNWRIRRRQLAAYTRVCILNVLNAASRPLNVHEIAFETGLSSEMVANHLRALVAGKVVCDRLIPPEPEYIRFKYYAICPKCPLKGNCEFEARMVWHQK